MLVGFYKTHEDFETDCKIIKFADRIWLLNQRGDALFRRQFVLEVSKESRQPLTEVRVAIPVENLVDVDVINNECFNEDLVFNSPHILTTSNYKIIKKPDNLIDHGVIEDDVNRPVKVFKDIKYSVFKVGENTPSVCNVVRLPLPSPLHPGDAMEARLMFKITTLCDIVNPSSRFAVNSIRLDYFVPCSKELSAVVGQENEIPILSELKPGSSNHPGGFDIWLYFLPGYEKVGGFTNTSLEVYDELHNFNGGKGKKRIKLGWKLRYLTDNKEVYSGENLHLSGQLAETYDTKSAMENIRKDIPIIKQGGKIGLILSIIAIVLAIVAIVLQFALD